MKKLLSILLSLMMALTAIPVAVFAQTQKSEWYNQIWYDEGLGELEVWGDFAVVRAARSDGADIIILVGYGGDDVDVVVPEGITAMTDGMYWKNRNEIVSITFPDSMTNLGYETMCSMAGLKEVYLPEGITRIAYAFANCPVLEKVNIPSTVTDIGYNAFSGCTAIKQIELPEGLQTIDSSAFQNTGLTEITIPSTVQWINQPFGGCNSLKKIVVTSSQTVLKNFSKNSVRSAVIYAPKGSEAESAAKKAGIPFCAIALNKTTLSLSKGKTYQLAFNSGSDATWKSSNSKVVSVSKTGKLTAKANGTATITATLYGKKYICKVTVQGHKTYTVKRGDTLWGIASKQLGNGRRYTEIMKLNGLKSTKIVAGQKLKLPER